MLVSSEKKLRLMMQKVVEIRRRYGMRIIVAKSKVMRKSEKEGDPLNIFVNGTKLEQVALIRHLGNMLTERQSNFSLPYGGDKV